MFKIRRTWTAQEADQWTKEDWITIVASVLAYICLTLGVGLSLLLLWYGFVIFLLGIMLTIFMHWIIDPKLKMVSAEYEKQQAGYLEELEKKIRWEDSK
jgi:uncharacterized membrane protein YagU involved in acid resistance